MLQAEEHDQGSNSYGAGECGRGDAKRRFISIEFAIRRSGGRSLVVLGPPAQVAPSDVVVEDVGDGDGRPRIGQVERSPDECTDQENWNVDVGENPELLAKEVEGERQNSANGETPHKAIVDGTRTEHLLGTKSAPKDRSGEESVVSGASEVIPLRWQADVGNLGHLIVENGRANEGGDESRPNLTVEGDPWSDVHVVGELKILSEVESVRGRDVSIRLEVVHGSGIPGEPETTEEFSDNVQGDFDIRDRPDDAARNTED